MPNPDSMVSISVMQYRRMIEHEMYMYLMDMFGDKIAICSNLWIPRDFHGLTGLVKINGMVYQIDIDCNDRKYTLSHFYHFIKWKKYNETVVNGVTQAILFVVRKEDSELIIDDELFAAASANNTVIRQIKQSMSNSLMHLQDIEDDHWGAVTVNDALHIRSDMFAYPLSQWISKITN